MMADVLDFYDEARRELPRAKANGPLDLSR
jgi:hypothetical protein